MRSVVEDGTGKDALELPFYNVGKTGTTDDCTYAWYTGYSKDMLCIVYLGYDNFSMSLGVKRTGSRVALPVWIDFMREAHKVRDDLFGDILPPANIEFHSICQDSGLIAVGECETVRDMPFIKNTQPRQTCTIHGKDNLQPYQFEVNKLILRANEPQFYFNSY